MKDLRKIGKKRIDLNTIRNYFNILEYQKLYDTVCMLMDSNVIKPVKVKGTNGMKPALFNEYFIMKEEKDYTAYKDEINFRLNPSINTSYYLKNIGTYLKDRKYILKFSEFWDKNGHILDTFVSKNERSFQIWQEEKFLSEGRGVKILKNLGFDLSILNIYETSEPIAYYSLNKTVPQNILIIENKDTFYSIRKFMIENADKPLFGERISTLIYGSGKKIYKSLEDFKLWGEPYFFDKSNKIMYFGDLDYEGIVIYEGIYDMFKDNFEIHLFKKAYVYMIEKYLSAGIELPESKDMQNKNIRDIFMSNFDEIYVEIILRILDSGRYIPQEILNINDFTEKCHAV